MDAARRAEIGEIAACLENLYPHSPAAAALRDLLAELRRREAEIEDWRGRLATQCGQTLAMRERCALAPIEPSEDLLREIAKAIAATAVNKRERCVEPADRAAWCADYAEDHWPEYMPEAREAYRVGIGRKEGVMDWQDGSGDEGLPERIMSAALAVAEEVLGPNELEGNPPMPERPTDAVDLEDWRWERLASLPALAAEQLLMRWYDAGELPEEVAAPMFSMLRERTEREAGDGE